MAPQREEHSALGPGRYRADLDGLRAIAVLAVVGFHAFPTALRGGFVGVDIFFVISGFLISSIVFTRVERSSFSIVEFYDRRIRRIFPALILVMTASLLFGFHALLADEYEQLGKHVAGGAGFLLNFMLWRESGYFDNAAQTKPLLHLWSLAIEEQFYLFWPLVLAFVWKRRWSLLGPTVAVAALSFVANMDIVDRSPAAAFYLPFTRFWELMVGSVLAYALLRRPEAVERYKDAQGMIGLALIVGSVLWIDESAPFPGWRALLPTLGTALVITAGQTALPNRTLLSDRSLVWIGLISYPLYLWHWPLLSFAQIVEGATPPPDVRLIAVVGSIGLAWLTYAFVERRIRFGTRSPRVVFGLVGLMALLGAGGFIVYATHGLASRESVRLASATHGDIGHDAFHSYMLDHFQPCTPLDLREKAPRWGSIVRCFQSGASAEKAVAIIGDSHAEHLFIGIAEAAPDVNVVYYTQGSLPVLSNDAFRSIFTYATGEPSIHTVVLAANWTSRMTGGPAQVESALLETTRALHAAGKAVYIAEDVPHFAFAARSCKSSGRFGQRNRCSEARAEGLRGQESIRALLERVARADGMATLLRLFDGICDPQTCFMARDGNLLYRDGQHLNILGSRYVGTRMLSEHPELGR